MNKCPASTELILLQLVIDLLRALDYGVFFIRAIHPSKSPKGEIVPQLWLVKVKLPIKNRVKADGLTRLSKRLKAIGGEKVLLVSSSKKTSAVKEYAEKFNIKFKGRLEIWDRDKLMSSLARFPRLQTKYASLEMKEKVKKKQVDKFDVFLAHNSKDKKQVIALAELLKGRGLSPRIDKEQIPPGRWFQDVIQKVIPKVKSAAIIIGPEGMGKFQSLELRTFIDQCLDRNLPVIPILLPGVTEFPRGLLFLKQLTWLRFNKSIDESDELDNLEWGITGEHPQRRMI